MTAVVGILNKQAIAIAADSAVTIDGSNGRKIFNKANKVFTLSKFHPVGIMIHNSASFMATPWETIIKIYRRQLGKVSFATIQDYLDNFIIFLRAKSFFTTSEVQTAFMNDFALMVINGIIDEVVRNHRNLIDDPTDENRNAFLGHLDAKVDEITGRFANFPCCPEFAEYSFDAFY